MHSSIVRVYQPSSHDGRILYISPNVEQEAIRELSVKKHHLLLELRNYDASNASLASTSGISTASGPSAAAAGAVKATKQLLMRGTSAVTKSVEIDTQQRPPGAIPVSLFNVYGLFAYFLNLA